jgi:hypothetical protein
MLLNTLVRTERSSRWDTTTPLCTAQAPSEPHWMEKYEHWCSILLPQFMPGSSSNIRSHEQNMRNISQGNFCGK